MYWRIRKLTPTVFISKLGVYVILSASLLFNLFLYTRISAAKALSAPQTDFYLNFAKQVTRHLFDANYLTVEDSMNELSSEIAGPALTKLKQVEIIPKDDESLKAMVRQLTDSQSVSTIKFDQLSADKPLTAGSVAGCLPLNLKIHVVVHDNDGVRPSTIRMRYYIGIAKNQKTNEQHPVVFDFEQLADPDS